MSHMEIGPLGSRITTEPAGWSQRPVDPPPLLLVIPDDAWFEVGDGRTTEGDGIEPWHRLHAHVTINGLRFNADAYAIVPDSDPQRAYQEDDDLDSIHTGVHGDKPFQTMTIREREYVVVLTPHC